MKNLVQVLGISVCLLCSVLFLLSCTSPGGEAAVTETKTTGNHTLDTVTIELMKFTPETLSISKGDTVFWVNKGFVAHTVQSYQNNKFYSDTIQPQASWKWVVEDSAAYFCSIHPTMLGKLIIK